MPNIPMPGDPMTLYSGNKFIFGAGTISKLADEVKALKGTKALVVTDAVLMKLGVIQPALDSLEAGGVPYVVYDKVLPDAPLSRINEAYETLKANDCDICVGIGGGSPMDTAKGVALMVTNGTDLPSMFGFFNVPKPGIPTIMAQTTNVGGADTGFVVVITNELVEPHDHQMILSNFAMADTVINDPMLTLTMPPVVTADCGIDILCVSIEGWTSSLATPYSDMLAEQCLRRVVQYLPTAVNRGEDLEARSQMALAASLTGWLYMTAWVGMPHGVGYGTAGMYGLTHGRSMSPTLPAAVRFNIAGNPVKHAKLATLLGKDVTGLSPMKAGEKAVEAVEEILESIGALDHLSDYGATEKDIPALTDASWGSASGLFVHANARNYTRDDVEAVMRASL